MNIAENQRPERISGFPYKVKVLRLIRGRYAQYPDGGQRPQSWAERLAGQDLVELDDGRTITLQSDGQQSSPTSGWILMLVGGDDKSGFQWTLYGLA